MVPVADVIEPSLFANGLRRLRGELVNAAATLAAVCLVPTDRCKWRGVEAETVLGRPGDVRAAPKLRAIIREFLLGEVRPVAELTPAVVRGTTDCDEGNIARLAVAEIGLSFVQTQDLGLDVALAEGLPPGSITPPLRLGLAARGRTSGTDFARDVSCPL